MLTKLVHLIRKKIDNSFNFLYRLLFSNIPGNQNDFYGHTYIAAQYCGVGSEYPPIAGNWPHGWFIPCGNYVSGDASEGNTNIQLFTWNENERRKAEKLGYHNPISIGSPFIYLCNPDFAPDNRNLFVAPIHSYWGYEGIIEQQWEAYYSELEKWLPMFDCVLVCLHQYEFSKPDIVERFQKLGCEVVLGASDKDQESLFRLRSYLQRCGFATTNQISTVTWYMAYAGCRVFIAGEPPALIDSILKSKARWWSQHPDVAATIERIARNPSDYVTNFPELPRKPEDAAKVIEAGKQELGYHYRRSPEELSQLFRWTQGRIILYRGLSLLYNALRRFRPILR